MSSKRYAFGAAAGAIVAVVALAGVTASWSLAASPGESPAEIANFGMMQHGTPPCASCHGVNGEGVRVQNGPRLAGLDADYLERQLDAFGEGRRNSTVMERIARTLNEDQRAALANYYAGLPAVTDARAPQVNEVALGQMIATQGNWSEKVPPCASCHAADGLGVGSFAPALAGQRADYLRRQLMRFRQNERRDDPLGLMRGISSRLSGREIETVAAYYASRPARPPEKPRTSGARQ